MHDEKNRLCDQGSGERAFRKAFALLLPSSIDPTFGAPRFSDQLGYFSQKKEGGRERAKEEGALLYHECALAISKEG